MQTAKPMLSHMSLKSMELENVAARLCNNFFIS